MAATANMNMASTLKPSMRSRCASTQARPAMRRIAVAAKAEPAMIANSLRPNVKGEASALPRK